MPRGLGPTLVLVLVTLPLAVAGEEGAGELVRGFVAGRFVDDYFGIVYRADGLVERRLASTEADPQLLWSGVAISGVEVELRCYETPRQLDGVAWRSELREALSGDERRREFEEGLEPYPWLLYVEESLMGTEHRYGHAFLVRPYQCFQVWASVRKADDASGEAIREALRGLELREGTTGFLLAHLIAKGEQDGPLREEVRIRAGMSYLEHEGGNPALALRLLQPVVAGPSDHDPDTRWMLLQGLGLAQLLLRELEDAVGTWQKAIEASRTTSEPAEDEMLSLYNLACSYALLGRLDEAFDALGEAYERGPAEGVATLKADALEDADLEGLRRDPRWGRLYGKP